MIDLSSDGLSYLLNDQSNTLALTPSFLTPYQKGLLALGDNDYSVSSLDAGLISGTQGDDYLISSSGNDTLVGGKGNDTLVGGGGSRLYGGKGDDILITGGARDTLTGGQGNDIFVLSANAAVTNVADADIITDFNQATDVIGLTEGLSSSSLSLEAVSGSSNTLIRIRESGAILAVVLNTSPDQLSNHLTSAQALLSNDLSLANNLGSLNGTQTVQGVVGDNNPAKLYRFTTTTSSNFNLTLNNLQADADVELIRDINGDQKIQVNDILAVSDQPGTAAEAIDINGLVAGTYYVRVYSYQNTDNTNFTLKLSATPTTTQPENNNSTTPGFDSRFGYGLVDAAAAVARAINAPTFSDVPNLGGNDWPRDLIKAPEVWAKGFKGDGVVVAVIDSGIDYNHPDLKDNVWTNPSETGFNPDGTSKASDGIDNDGNGYVDDVHGWNFLADNNNILDDNGHGTHTAGLIAAEENGIGITGVAPHAKIMPLKVLDKNGSGKISDEIEAIHYAVDNGANVINLSLGGRDFNADELNAIRYAEDRGVVVVSAAGNDSLSRSDYPARFASSYGIAVGSVNRNLQLSYYSNWAGSTPLTYVVAPGGSGGSDPQNNIYSTYSSASSSFPGTLYRYLAGTSMAAPQVAGVVALIHQANPNLSAAEIEAIIADTANSAAVIA